MSLFQGLRWCIVLVSFFSHAQLRKPIRVLAQADGIVSSNTQTPLWLRANQFGLVPLNAPAGIFRAGVSMDFATVLPDTAKALRRKLDWGLGVEGAAIVGKEQGFLLPEAYVKLRYGRVELWGGRRREFIGIADTSLTSGSIAWSGNALPIPKIQIGTAGFIPLKFLKDFVAIKASFAHSWFNVPYIQGVYLHSKSIHARFGKGPVTVFAGINHFVQWGGHADYLINSPLAVNGHLTTAPKDFLTGVLLGQLSSERHNDRYTGFDGENRIGNHLGNYDFSVSYQRPKARWLLYHQHIFEDLSGLLFINGFDGLYGLSWTNKDVSRKTFQLNKVLVEWLATANQAGSTFDIYARFQGGDNYFNHSQYVEGWSYFNRGIGTPLLPTHLEISRENLPYIQNFFPSNRVNIGYVALQASAFSALSLEGRFSYGTHLGTYSVPFPSSPRQFTSLLSVFTQPHLLHSFEAGVRLAYDNGKLLPRTFGASLTIRKAW